MAGGSAAPRLQHCTATLRLTKGSRMRMNHPPCTHTLLRSQVTCRLWDVADCCSPIPLHKCLSPLAGRGFGPDCSSPIDAREECCGDAVTHRRAFKGLADLQESIGDSVDAVQDTLATGVTAASSAATSVASDAQAAVTAATDAASQAVTAATDAASEAVGDLTAAVDSAVSDFNAVGPSVTVTCDDGREWEKVRRSSSCGAPPLAPLLLLRPTSSGEGRRAHHRLTHRPIRRDVCVPLVWLTARPTACACGALAGSSSATTRQV